MSTFQTTCPHCDTVKVGFTITHDWVANDDREARYFVSRCGHCDKPVSGRLVHSAGGHSYTLTQLNGDIARHHLVLIDLWPVPSVIEAPEFVPENISNYFKQGLRAQRAQSWDAAGMMFRKVLEVATKKLFPASENKSLVKRIDDMRLAGRLTEDLVTWAHEIRLEGNEAAHEDEPYSEKDCADLKYYCEYFLIYTYSLPQRIASRRDAPTI